MNYAEHFEAQRAQAVTITQEHLDTMITNRAQRLSEEELAYQKARWLNESLIGQQVLYFMKYTYEAGGDTSVLTLLVTYDHMMATDLDGLSFVRMSNNIPVFVEAEASDVN